MGPGKPFGRVLCSACIVAAVTFGVQGVGADQTDERLPALFDQLASAGDAAQAGAIEQQIWQIWLQVPDAPANERLRAGTAAMNLGDMEVAIAEFDALVEMAPDFAEGWNKRATALYLARRYAESVRDIERTLALEPRHFGALSGMGLIFLQQGDPGGALKAFEAVLRVHPMSPSARIHVERLKNELGTPA